MSIGEFMIFGGSIVSMIGFFLIWHDLWRDLQDAQRNRNNSDMD